MFRVLGWQRHNCSLLEEHVKPLSCHPAKTQSQHRAHPLNDHHDDEHSPNDHNNDDDVEDV